MASTPPTRAWSPGPQRIGSLTYEETQELAEAGAKVLNAQAVEFAKEKGIAIYARATASSLPGADPSSDGTVVRRNAPRLPGTVAGVASERDILVLQARGDATRLLALLDECGVSGKQLHVAALGGNADGTTLVISRENLHNEERLTRDLAAAFGERRADHRRPGRAERRRRRHQRDLRERSQGIEVPAGQSDRDVRACDLFIPGHLARPANGSGQCRAGPARGVRLTAWAWGLVNQAQPDDVGEVSSIERPEGGLVRDGTGGNGEIDLAAPGAPHLAVGIGRQRGFPFTERNRLGRGEECFLGAQLLANTRAAEPLVKDQCRQPHALALVNELAQPRSRPLRTGQRVDEHRRVQVNHVRDAVRRPPCRRARRMSASSLSTARTGRRGTAGTTRSNTSSMSAAPIR